MKKAELMNLVGEKVVVKFIDGDRIYGILGYADEFSAKHNYIKPDYFYIGNMTFRASYVKQAQSERA